MEYTHPTESESVDLQDPDFSEFEDVDGVISRGMRQARYNAGTEDMVYLGGHVENVRRQLEKQGYDERV